MGRPQPARNSRSLGGEFAGFSHVNLDDADEIGGLQAGAADQRAVDIGGSHQFRGVRGFYRTAVEDAEVDALAIAEEVAKLAPYVRVHVGYFAGGRGEAGADRPDRLIGDD